MAFHLFKGNTYERCPACGQDNRVRILTLRFAMRFLLVDYNYFLLALTFCVFVDICTKVVALSLAFLGAVLGSIVLGCLKWRCKHA